MFFWKYFLFTFPSVLCSHRCSKKTTGSGSLIEDINIPFASSAFDGAITINKNDYGLTYGGSMLGEDVTIDFAIEMNPPKPVEESDAE